MKSKALCLLIFISSGFAGRGQSVEQQMTTKRVECRDVFMNTAATISKLYDAKEYDSIRVAVAVIQQYCDNNGAAVVYINTLLDIQQTMFNVSSLDSGVRLNTLLEEYPMTIKYLRRGGYSVNRYQYYHYPGYEKDFYALVARWANDLLQKPVLTPEETFICNVLAGNIKHPEAELRAHKSTYPELYALLQKNYGDARSQHAGVFTITTGMWMPSGNLSVLGTHPAIGFQAGGRGKSNELDLTINFKFIKTPNEYVVLRSDSLYSLHHFFGGYIGLDYSHYFYHSVKFEAGLMGGIGYDGFDIADPGDNDHSEDYLKPFGIGSLNLNTGFRVNYFFNPKFFIGIIAKYNYLNYGNKGGTNMKGNAFSIDLVIGG